MEASSPQLEGGLGKRTAEKLQQIKKAVDEAKMSTPLNFIERFEEEDEKYTPSQLRRSSYLNMTNGKSGNLAVRLSDSKPVNESVNKDALSLRGELKSARIIRHDNDSSLIYNDAIMK